MAVCINITLKTLQHVEAPDRMVSARSHLFEVMSGITGAAARTTEEEDRVRSRSSECASDFINEAMIDCHLGILAPLHQYQWSVNRLQIRQANKSPFRSAAYINQCSCGC